MKRTDTGDRSRHEAGGDSGRGRWERRALDEIRAWSAGGGSFDRGHGVHIAFWYNGRAGRQRRGAPRRSSFRGHRRCGGRRRARCPRWWARGCDRARRKLGFHGRSGRWPADWGRGADGLVFRRQRGVRSERGLLRDRIGHHLHLQHRLLGHRHGLRCGRFVQRRSRRMRSERDVREHGRRQKFVHLQSGLHRQRDDVHRRRGMRDQQRRMRGDRKMHVDANRRDVHVQYGVRGERHRLHARGFVLDCQRRLRQPRELHQHGPRDEYLRVQRRLLG